METSMSNRPRRNLSAVLAPLTMIVSAVLVSGCGGDKLSDDAYGFIDLAPYYYDGSSAANPSAGLPREIAPTKGWLNGVRAEYYDFGLVGTVKKRADTRLIDYATIPAMYFFFDSGNNPLFSKPVFEPRTGQWHMRGGKDVLNPNPAASAKKDVPYSVRTRSTIGSFQRPIIDRLQHNTDYTGLWEIWEVTAPDGYDVDSVKSFATLDKGIKDGTFGARRTKKVINCPVLDDRQYVTPSPLFYGIPHPRIELWYRTKQGSCYLADGWYTLGEGTSTLIKGGANNDSRRLQMFDVISYTIGSGEGARTTIVAPVSKMYIPTAYVAALDTRAPTQLRYSGDNVTDVMPRYTDADPPGYRPIRWLWDLQVPQDPPYKPASYRSVAQMDPVAMINRQGPFTKNFPTIGLNVPCTLGGEPVCDGLPHAPDVPLTCVKQFVMARSPLDGSAASGIQDEPGGPRCDVPQGRFGEFCAPAIAGCQYDVNAMTPGADLDFVTANKTANSGVLVGGYTCQPNTNTGGFCQLRCDSDASSSDSKETEEISVKYKGPDGQEKTDKGKYMGYDKRCGNLPGYKCLNPVGTVPTTQRVCLRSCDGGKPDTFNDVYCQLPMTEAINDRVGGQNVQLGQKCSTRGLTGASGCQWDPAYEPREKKSNFLPQ
jgi:hypothetical protein